jgi:hypothetical protein
VQSSARRAVVEGDGEGEESVAVREGRRKEESSGEGLGVGGKRDGPRRSAVWCMRVRKGRWRDPRAGVLRQRSTELWNSEAMTPDRPVVPRAWRKGRSYKCQKKRQKEISQYDVP